MDRGADGAEAWRAHTSGFDPAVFFKTCQRFRIPGQQPAAGTRREREPGARRQRGLQLVVAVDAQETYTFVPAANPKLGSFTCCLLEFRQPRKGGLFHGAAHKSMAQPELPGISAAEEPVFDHGEGQSVGR